MSVRFDTYLIKVNNMAENFNTRQTLLLKVQNQYDDQSWEDFVYYYQGYIRIVVKSLGVDNEAIKDQTQEILLALWKKLPSFVYNPEKCKFRTRMNVVIRNSIYSYFRGKNRYSKRLENFKNDSSEDLENPEVYKIAEKHWKEHISLLAWERISPTLDENNQKCFLLLEEGKKPEDVAEIIGVKKNTVYVMRKRVIQKLQAEIRHLDEELN